MRRRRAWRQESVPVKLSFACHMVRHDTYNTQNYCFLLKNTQKNSKTFPHEGFRPMPGSLLGYLDGCFFGCGACRCLGLGVLLFYAIVSFSRFIAEFGCVVVVVYCCVLLFYSVVLFLLCCLVLLLLFIVLFCILFLYFAVLFRCLVFAFYCCVCLFGCRVNLLPKFVM